MLPIALGEATKTVSYVLDGAKTYRFTVRWGEARATDDADGEVTATSEVRPDADDIRRTLPRFLGEIEQVPPAFSAVKIGGRRAYYELARAEEAVELKPRRVRVDAIELVEVPDRDHATFEARCGKGTYMRSLARDLARALGTYGHIASLRRIAVGPFTEHDAIPLDSLEGLMHSGAFAERLLPVETALDDIPALALAEAEAHLLRSGQAVPLFRASDRDRIGRVATGETVCATSGGKPVALARLEHGRLRPVRVFNL